VLNTPGNETTLSAVVSLNGAAPNATYHVGAVQGPRLPHCISIPSTTAVLHTNGRGNGTVEFSGERLPFGTTTFFVEMTNEANPFEEFASPAVELD
jgi:hypothetical protein